MAVTNLLTDPPVLPLVAPSVLAADFGDMGAECAAVLEAGADLLHLDVMDGHFVPNLTMGPALCRALRQRFPDAFLDVHLMVTRPATFVTPFVDAGADHLTVHVEAEDDPAALADTIHAAGITAGLAINPPTPVDHVSPLLGAFDMILVMSVNPGFGGQAFIDSVLEKTRAIASRLGPRQRLEMDGGVSGSTAPACTEAGCDVLVAGSAIFATDDYAAAVRAVRGSSRIRAGSHT